MYPLSFPVVLFDFVAECEPLKSADRRPGAVHRTHIVFQEGARGSFPVAACAAPFTKDIRVGNTQRVPLEREDGDAGAAERTSCTALDVQSVPAEEPFALCVDVLDEPVVAAQDLMRRSGVQVVTHDGLSSDFVEEDASLRFQTEQRATCLLARNAERIMSAETGSSR